MTDAAGGKPPPYQKRLGPPAKIGVGRGLVPRRGYWLIQPIRASTAFQLRLSQNLAK